MKEFLYVIMVNIVGFKTVTHYCTLQSKQNKTFFFRQAASLSVVVPQKLLILTTYILPNERTLLYMSVCAFLYDIHFVVVRFSNVYIAVI